MYKIDLQDFILRIAELVWILYDILNVITFYIIFSAFKVKTIKICFIFYLTTL